MANKVCYLSEVCPYYSSGDNKPSNHDVRNHFPCVKYLDNSCEMDINVRLFFKEEILCDVNKIKKIKGGI